MPDKKTGFYLAIIGPDSSSISGDTAEFLAEMIKNLVYGEIPEVSTMLACLHKEDLQLLGRCAENLQNLCLVAKNVRYEDMY